MTPSTQAGVYLTGKGCEISMSRVCRSSRVRLLPRLGLCALSVATACGLDGIPGPPLGFDHAASAQACGPTDGPAVAIYLAGSPVESLDPSPPYLQVAVWQSLHDLAERSWSVAGAEAQGGAWFYSTNDDFELATSGHVVVNAVRSDSTIEGSVTLRFPTAGRVTGSFRAPWRYREPDWYCG